MNLATRNPPCFLPISCAARPQSSSPLQPENDHRDLYRRWYRVLPHGRSLIGCCDESQCDLKLTLMTSSLYRLLAARIGRGYQTAKSQHIFRDFIDATASVRITEDEILMHFQKHAHNPLFISVGFHETDICVPWMEGKRLQLIFG